MSLWVHEPPPLPFLCSESYGSSDYRFTNPIKNYGIEFLVWRVHMYTITLEYEMHKMHLKGHFLFYCLYSEKKVISLLI